MKIWTKLGLLTLVGLSLTSCGSNTKNAKGQSSSSQKVETSAGASKSNIYADPSTLSDKYDVIIVGSGGAGMTTTIEAKDAGMNPVIFRKNANCWWKYFKSLSWFERIRNISRKSTRCR